MVLIAEVSSVVLGLIQSLLVMLNKRSNWIAYIAQMVALATYSFMSKLYGDGIESILFIAIGIIGYILWSKSTSHVTWCSLSERFAYIFLIIVLFCIQLVIFRHTDDSAPVLDAGSSAIGYIATLTMLLRKIDTWILWFIADILYVIEYLIIPLPAYYLAGLNAVWCGFAIASLLGWIKIYKHNVQVNE